ncbi:MAG: SDR family NAD(P)-dependent oxidoreductase, partial [Anaerolineae bacterium]|nr:SDR family NAD(P)-dependent oxidoreductase [Anaerolineae bacterium]
PALPAPAVDFDLDDIQSRCGDWMNGVDYYQSIRDLGLEFGPNFRGIRELWRRDGEAVGRIELPEELYAQTGQYLIHPAFLDACFHLLGAPLPGDGADMAYLLIGIDSFQLYQTPDRVLWNHTLLQETINSETFTGDIYLFAEDGSLVAEVRGLQLKRAGREALMQATQQRPTDLCYEVEWLPKPNTQQENALLSPLEIAQTVSASVDQAVATFPSGEFADLLTSLDRVSLVYVVFALRDLGWNPVPGERITVEALMTQLGVVDHYQRLMYRLLDMLAEDGYLRYADGEYEVIQPLPVGDSGASIAELVAAYPAYQPLMVLLERCGASLGAVLSGDVDPLHLLFPDGSLADTEALYENIPTTKLYNEIVRQIMEAAQANGDRRLRVLEIGAGTGGTTTFVLPALADSCSEYVFTDLSPLFLDRAKSKYADYPFMRYQLLDIEQNPAEQGFAGQQFDLILAANVLHATADLAQTVAHVRQLLAPGGRLILEEGMRAQRWVDLTFGLTEGWWRFADLDRRPNYPLMTQAGWYDLLQAAGFQEVAMLPEVDDDHVLIQQSIVVASTTGAGEQAVRPGSWLIFADEGGVGSAIARDLTAAGSHCVVVRPDVQFSRLDEFHCLIAPDHAEDYQQVLASSDQWAGVVYLWGLDGVVDESVMPQDLEAVAMADSRNVLYLSQALIAQGAAVPLWLITENAQPVDVDRMDVGDSPLWGFGRVLALEYPALWGGLIDLNREDAATVKARGVLAEITNPDGEDQLALREHERYVARLARTAVPKSKPISFRADGSYLITGGTGGLGLELARWLAEHGAGHIILTSRRGLPDRSQWVTAANNPDVAQQIATVEAIEALGTEVTAVALDVTDADGMARLVNEYSGSLRGVFHLAAMLAFWPIQDMPEDGLAAMLRTKMTGAWTLHQLTAELPLDHFVMFSSTTALWGVTGMAHYAAANTFLDTLAYYRQSHGLPGLSVNWGTWEEMRIASTEEQEAVAQFGLKQMSSADALAILGDIMADASVRQMAVAAVDWSVLKPAYEVRRERPFLANVDVPMKRAVRRAESVEVSQGPSLLEQLAELAEDERREALIDHVSVEVADILGMNAGSVDIHRGLFEMGMDSLMSVDLKSHLEKRTGLSLPSTLTFNYPTVAELAEYLDGRLTPPPAPARPVEPQPVPVSQTSAAEIDELSEDDLEALLLKKLKGLK